ncbi:MAG: hypothetical protein ACI4R9_00635 [Kiritimatiellia bacterium]
MKEKKIGLLSAVALTAVMSSFAGDIAWNPETKAYEIPAGDTLTIATDAEITSDYTFTGEGKIVLTSAKIDLNYPMDAIPFAGFTGTIELTGGANVAWGWAAAFTESKDGSSILGKPAKIVFNGMTLTGFWRSNNTAFNSEIEIRGDANTLNNTAADSLAGVNLTLKKLSGDGTLNLVTQDRWVKFTGDLSEFTGSILIPENPNGNSAGIFFQDEAATGNSQMLLEYAKKDKRLYFYLDADQTIELGALRVFAPAPGIDIKSSGCTVKVGGRAASASEIGVPFIVNAVTLQKVGADSSLKLDGNVSFLSGSKLLLDEGTLILDGMDLTQNLTSTFASGTLVQVTANGAKVPRGTAFGKIELAAGAIVAVPGESTWGDNEKVALFTYADKAEGLTFSAENVKPGIASPRYTIIDDEAAKTVYCQLNVPTLTWNGGTDALWTDENVWLNGETPATFTEGDSVQLTDGQSVRLDTSVVVRRLSMTGEVTIQAVGEAARLEVATFEQSGTLTLSGRLALDALLDADGAYAIPADSRVTLARAQAIGQNSGVFAFTGAGELVFDGAQIGSDERFELNYALTSDNPFSAFEGTVCLTNDVYVLYKRTLGDYTDTNPRLFGTAVLDVAGMTIEGFYQANNVRIRDLVVRDGKNLISNQRSTGGTPANFIFERKISGDGTIEVDQPWNSGRGVKFQNDADLTEFTGAVKMSGSGWASVETQKGTGPSVSWDLGEFDHLWITGQGQTLQFGSINFPRYLPSNQGYFQVGASGMTLEIGGKANSESLFNPPFTGNAFTLKKVGETSSLTMGKLVTMIDGSSVDVVAGRLILNAGRYVNAEVATDSPWATPITVRAGAFLAGTGWAQSVTFEPGAGVDTSVSDAEKLTIADPITLSGGTIRLRGTLDSAQTYPVLIAGTGSTASKMKVETDEIWAKGTWSVRWTDLEDGTRQLVAGFNPAGLTIIVR